MMELSQQQMGEVLAILERGGVLLYPTETSYGLGCDATNDAAVQRIYEMKNRPSNKAMTVLLPGVESATQYVQLNDRAQALAAQFWPGPLNIIAPLTPESPIVHSCALDGQQSARVSSHSFARALTQQFGKPIVSTSANASGKPPAYTMKEVRAVCGALSGAPDAVINGGDLPVRPASTVVRVDGEEVHILRQGEIDVSYAG